MGWSLFRFSGQEGDNLMAEKKLLKDKKILIVDDEPDVLETVASLLTMCEVTTAGTFEKGRKYLETREFDIAILDVMGVDGYRLLEIANQREIIAVILTAHALSVEDTVKSFKGGAASYIPKEKLSDIAVFLNDVLEAKEKGKPYWWRWFDRFSSFYDKKFGKDWQDKDVDFWKKFMGYL